MIGGGATDPGSDAWVRAASERRLEIQRCQRCGWYQHYPRILCARCGATRLELVEACGRATIYSFTQVRPPTASGDAEYTVALVRLEEGPLLLTRIVGDGEVACDQPVRLDWELMDEGRLLPVFRVVDRRTGSGL